MIARRTFLTGLVSALAAPAIVRVESIMPVRAPKLVTVVDVPWQNILRIEISNEEWRRLNMGVPYLKGLDGSLEDYSQIDRMLTYHGEHG